MTFDYGFVTDVRAEQLSLVLGSPAARFVRGVTLTGKRPLVEAGLAELARAERPWLRRLTIAPRFRGDPPELWNLKATYKAANLSQAAIADLIAATPRLEVLRLAGHRLLREFPHPAVRTLVIDGINALFAALVERDPMPRVRDLVLAFAHEPDAPILLPRPLPPMLPAASFPALRRLDVSPNEELRAITDTQVDVFTALSRVDLLPQLEELRVPSVRNENEAVQVQRALDRMPGLRRLEIVRACVSSLSTRAERVIDELPWPRLAWATGAIEIQFLAARKPHRLGMREAVRLCEAQFRDFDPADRAAWTELWRTAMSPEVHALPVRTLTRALDALGYIEANRPGMKAWWQVREAARDASPDDEVGILRVDR